MKSSFKPSEIAIVALDAKKLAAEFKNYKKLTAKQKIQHIEKIILISYAEFKKSPEKKLIIFVKKWWFSLELRDSPSKTPARCVTPGININTLNTFAHVCT